MIHKIEDISLMSFNNRFLTAKVEVSHQIAKLYGIVKTDPMERELDFSRRVLAEVKRLGVKNEAAILLGIYKDPVKRYPTPEKEGYYWAKWRLPDHTQIDRPSETWEVVEVWENHNDESRPDRLQVSVTGVAKTQDLDAFFWGPGPLTEPI